MILATLDLRARRLVASYQGFARLMAAGGRSLTEAWSHRSHILRAMSDLGSDATLLVMVSGTFIGLVLALEWGTKLEPFGAKYLMGRIVAIGVIREIGPVLTGLMVAGRTASKMASELGSMKVTEQIDALRALGVDPVSRLVMPRQIASMITLLPLTLLADIFAILGGWFVATRYLDTPGHFYWTSALDSLTFKDLSVGFAKPVFFGYFIATISSFCGLGTVGGSAGVGRSATRAVMYSSVSILIADFLLGKLVLTLWG